MLACLGLTLLPQLKRSIRCQYKIDWLLARCLMKKGFFSVETRDYFMHTPNLMATAYFMVMVFPSLALMDFIVTLSTDTAP
ncbi:hypothetical protein [Helicobacter pylori]|uniref:hypothetical protein n=1 Tax=Helicobacter pylori TaxID=210 RepID=UPI0013CE2534|nr:hypothetical protein [Helicobacter pylori]